MTLGVRHQRSLQRRSHIHRSDEAKKIADDSKEREYIVVSMTPREDSKTSESISSKINHLPKLTIKPARNLIITLQSRAEIFFTNYLKIQ
ncbi:MAG: hypothetical protein DMG86_06790 [Acidobacteria bacterium]|nr:MAG: hypothetical protein DMG86_06790 [Acidobacteriota bacterium]